VATKPKGSKITGTAVATLGAVALPDAPNTSSNPEVWVTWALNRAEYNARMAAANETVRSLGESLAAMKTSGRFATDAWERMFNDHKNPYKTHFPFSKRTANRFVSIHKSPLLSSGTHVSRLPTAWGTLYELSTLPPARLERALERGLITPDMERKDVKLLMPPKQQAPAPDDPMEEGIAAVAAASEKLVEVLLALRPYWKKLSDGQIDQLRMIVGQAGTKLTELESRHS